MTRVAVTLVMDLETDKGAPLTERQALDVIADTKGAIQNRLFGNGFLPDDVIANQWDVCARIVPPEHASGNRA